MKIWNLKSDVNNYSGFKFAEGVDSDKLTNMRITLKKCNPIYEWNPALIIEEKSDITDNYNPNQFGDNPVLWGLSTSFMISQKAKDILEESFKKEIQFLPINDIDNNTFYIINTLSLLDALDFNKTIFKVLLDKYRVDVTTPVFKSNIIYPPIFRIYLDENKMVLDRVYVTDEFKSVVVKNGLKGFKFIEVDEV